MRRLCLVVLLMSSLPVAGHAAQATADWPCVQRMQPHLSLGQVWTGPVPDASAQARVASPDIAALADAIAERRMPLADAEARIAEFAQGRDAAALTALMQGVFDRIDRHRARLIEGIGRFGNKQVSLAARIETHRARMAELSAAQTPDFDAIDATEEALDWDSRVFEERQQSLTYVCETPVILEQRLFALGRAIAGHLPAD